MANKDGTPLQLPRRKFFIGAGALSALIAGGFGWLTFRHNDSITRLDAGGQIIPGLTEGRLIKAYRLRQNRAAEQLSMPMPSHSANGDEKHHRGFIACYTKGLPHNEFGEVDAEAYRMLLEAMASGSPEAVTRIPLGGPVKLANPMGAFAYQLDGADSHHLTMAPAPSITSDEHAGEMAEVYWHALARDVPFSRYAIDSLTQTAIRDLAIFPQFGDISSHNLFRGPTPSDRTGPYVSQFLWQDVPYGSQTLIQKYNSPTAGIDFMTQSEECLRILSGYQPTAKLSYDANERYIRNGRELGEWVHHNFSYQSFLDATLILLSYGEAALKPGHPYRSSRTQSGFTTFGGPDILATVAHASSCALKAAWFQKWCVHRRIRPEAYALHVDTHLAKRRDYPVGDNLLNSAAIALVRGKTGRNLLPMAYPEGCPTHPSYPSGHAVVAGACATVLKAYFNEDYVIPDPVIAADNGLSLHDYRGEALTMGGEINKLASNIAIGRDFAGVHWRSDGIEGLKLGEQVAVRLLMDVKHTYSEVFPYTFTKFNGEHVSI